jgi:hypothetical protein
VKRKNEQVKRKKEPTSADGWVDVTDAGKYPNNEYYPLTAPSHHFASSTI